MTINYNGPDTLYRVEFFKNNYLVCADKLYYHKLVLIGTYTGPDQSIPSDSTNINFYYENEYNAFEDKIEYVDTENSNNPIISREYLSKIGYVDCDNVLRYMNGMAGIAYPFLIIIKILIIIIDMKNFICKIHKIVASKKSIFQLMVNKLIKNFMNIVNMTPFSILFKKYNNEYNKTTYNFKYLSIDSSFIINKSCKDLKGKILYLKNKKACKLSTIIDTKGTLLGLHTTDSNVNRLEKTFSNLQKSYVT